MSEGPQYAYVVVADAIEAEIRTGRIPLGGALPNERDLGARYGVAAGTVRRAVRELRARGLVATLASKGTYVVATPED
jgi:DNA-binding GntR family transcriptional regulator